MTLRNYSSSSAATTLSAGVNASATTLAVTGTTGFPAVPFILAVDAGAAAQELVLVTNVAGLTLTVTRGYDSTTAVAHVTGAVVAHSHGGIDFREANTHVNASTGVHGIAGAAVGTTDAQALTNKTVALGSNTVSGTKAQFNAALTDADFATQDGVETLTNKDLTSGTNAFPLAQPRGVLGYAQATAAQAGITALADLTGLTVTVTVGASRRIRVSAHVGFRQMTAAGQAEVRIHEGATQLQRFLTLPDAGIFGTQTPAVVLTPSAGSHTYNLKATANAGTMETAVGADYPAYILVEDIGAA